MKLLHILNEITFSGAEVMLKVASPIFFKNRFDLYVLSTGNEVGRYSDTLRNSGYTIHHIPFKKSPKYFLVFYRFLYNERFDVIHIHSERAFFWHALLAWLAGCRTIIRTIHDVFLFSGFLRIKRSIQRAVARSVFNVSYTAIGNSVMEIEQQYFRNPTVIVKNWVDESYFQPPTTKSQQRAKYRFGFNTEDIVIISVGTCNQKKNHYAIFDAISKVNRSKTCTVKYLHRGTGPTLDDENGYAKKVGVNMHTKFVDFLEDVRMAYWAADIFVMTSGWEGLGNAILEAMNCGLPVILYDVLGMRDTIVNGKGGYLIEANSDSLASAIKKLALNEELRNQMGIEAKQSVLKNFNKQKSLEKLMKIYRGAREV